ncbi:MAG: hypothetical protein N3F04_05205 [Candidatus Nezhaarchaeota archaeon]|nr:hypothetical protein [Candidatus Nezhaarchaeota archaeon]MCX8142144.1 hypothetical protein [Candidatus Nezhaarchaeota archaeon]MDW8050075.1 hypothetical protein [Nitrososphaerota archaeon]
MTKLIIERLGVLSEAEVESSLSILRRFYNTINDPPPLVYVLIVGNRSSFLSLLTTLHQTYCVQNVQSYENFEAAHNAYTGAPQIIICLESLRKLSHKVAEGILLHEAAHTVLHGFLEAYLAPINLIHEAAKLIGLEQAANLVYAVAMAVKDYEASKLLVDLGLRAEAKMYALHLLSKTKDLEEEWKISLRLNLALLHLAELLKPLCCAIPILPDPEVHEAIDTLTSHLPLTVKCRLRGLIEDPRWVDEKSLWEKIKSLLLSLATIL